MRTSASLLFPLLAATLFAFSGITQPASAAYQQQARVDREYRLEASILGYKGVGGAIDGIRNPLLQAAKGETVRITIVNAEVLAHDIALDKIVRSCATAISCWLFYIQMMPLRFVKVLSIH
jgi:hypothetical protein